MKIIHPEFPVFFLLKEKRKDGTERKMLKTCKTILLTLFLVMAFSVGISADTYDNSVVYVPMDNRPINTDRVQYLIGSIGYNVVMPSEDLYATKLDNQPKNANNTQYGNTTLLLQWLQEKDIAGCNMFVISLDQVLSGGLVNSRVAVFESEDDVQQKYDDIDKILGVLAKDPNNKIYFTDTVMRLASTVEYGGLGENHSNALRSYGSIPRKTLTGDSLTIEKIVQGYAYNTTGVRCENVLKNDNDGSKRALLVANDKAVLNNYLKARERKLRLIDHVLRNEDFRGENVFFFIGIDDSTAGGSVQTNEITYIKNLLGNQGVVFDGADELGMMAISRMYAEQKNQTVSVKVQYFGGNSEIVGNYETAPLSEVISKHLSGINGVETSSNSANVSLLVLTPPANAEKKHSYCMALVNTYLKNIENKVPTIIVDASQNNEYESYLQTLLVENTPLGYLIGYSNWNTIGNSVGIGVTEGLSRYRYLTSSGEKTDAANNAFLKMMTFGFVKDIAYKRSVSNSMYSYIENTLGLNNGNFYGTSANATNRSKIRRALEDQMRTATVPILNNLRKSNVITDLVTYKVEGISTLSISSYYFPWFRVFECDFDVVGGSLTSPHPIVTTPVKEVFVHNSYINGYSDGTFRPENKLTRGEISKMIVSVKQVPTSTYQGTFLDVSEAQWAWSYIEAAANKKYLTGYGDGTFSPEKNMTRAEFAAFLVKVAAAENITINTKNTYFSDVANTAWYYSDVMKASSLGFIKGYEDGTFCPEKEVTRCEGVTMLNRLLKRSLKDEGLSQSGILQQNPFSDINSSYWGYLDVLEAAVTHQYEVSDK